MKLLSQSAARRQSTAALALFALLAPGHLCVSRRSPTDKEKDPDEIGNRDVGKGVNFYSIEKEIALGKQMAQEVERQAKIVDDPVIAEYVNRIGQNLVRNSDAKVPFTIKVIDAEEINAFALPGGFFFVNTGILLNADNEAEMAGVMAHEIAHVAARHGTRQATEGRSGQLGSIPLIFLGRLAGYAIRQGMGLAVPMGFLNFSPRLRIRSRHAGPAVHVQGRLRSELLSSISSRKCSRRRSASRARCRRCSRRIRPPTTASRTAQKNIQEYLKAKPEYVVSTSEFDDVKARVMAMHNSRTVDNSKDPAGRRCAAIRTARSMPTATRRRPPADQDDRPT